ncbi:flagellar motor protein MotS [Oceanobacillus sp. FSL K6-2867]|uniref:flagellar motor protein MotS n=1 Tax=Oceanobacillus sp. FSL K6-2867 TaxID=2954748 RepID=UPI0030D849E7
MKRRETRKRDSRGTPKWMVTYSDMVTLILVFFILLFSMSQIDLNKFKAISESFQNRMILDFSSSAIPMDNPAEQINHEEIGEQLTEHELPSITDDALEQGYEEDPLNSLLEDVEAYLNENDLNEVITANRTERGVVLVLQDSIFFETGEADILEEGEPFLQEIGYLLMEIPNEVKVEGHTDSRPVSSFRYPSNWELSGGRASSVVRYLIKQFNIDESRFSIAGYGDTRPIMPNDTESNMRENRRVEIIIMNKD